MTDVRSFSFMTVVIILQAWQHHLETSNAMPNTNKNTKCMTDVLSYSSIQPLLSVCRRGSTTLRRAMRCLEQEWSTTAQGIRYLLSHSCDCHLFTQYWPNKTKSTSIFNVWLPGWSGRLDFTLEPSTLPSHIQGITNYMLEQSWSIGRWLDYNMNMIKIILQQRHFGTCVVGCFTKTLFQKKK